MKPVNEVLEIFKYELFDLKLAADMEVYLQQTYPEAVWKVSLGDDRRVIINTLFDTPENQTLLMLKWI